MYIDPPLHALVQNNHPMKPIFEKIAGTDINAEQTSYLDGFFNGLAQQGVRFTDMEPDPTVSHSASQDTDSFCKEEKLKHKTDLNKTYQLVDKVSSTATDPDPEETFLLKWHGLFHLAPKQDGFMCRLRIPGGYVRDYQLRELAHISRDRTTGYIQLTTRANFQLRVIPLKHASEVLQRIQSVGLHSKGAGADNVRNITASPCAGLDPLELIDVKPICQQLAQLIINTDEFYNLPRKFNIALDGGGAVGLVEDTNDIGAKAVRIEDSIAGVPPGVYFLIALGGVTGHKTFANDAGILISKDELVEVILNMVRVFIENGNRSSRKKARLKYLLEDWGFERFLTEVDTKQSKPLTRLTREDMEQIKSWNPPRESTSTHPQLGIHPQKQKDLNYVGVGIPTGILTPDQLESLATLCGKYGNGEARLTVWQNLIIPNVASDQLDPLKKEILDLGLYVDASPIRSGVIACTGNAYCKFAGANTKAHAKLLMDHLERSCGLDQPINIHITGCPHSCAQHYIGDIGLLATQVKSGDKVEEGYHIFVGGGFGEHREIGRQIAKAVSMESLPGMLEALFNEYLASRWPNESFHEFTLRHPVEALQSFLGDPKIHP
jgi:ferredoxin-nitrite reductase